MTNPAFNQELTDDLFDLLHTQAMKGPSARGGWPVIRLADPDMTISEHEDVATTAARLAAQTLRDVPLRFAPLRMAALLLLVRLGQTQPKLCSDPIAAAAAILALAAGEISEAGLARWIRDNLPKP